MTLQRVPYTKPSITAVEISEVEEAVRVGWGARCYEHIERFEALFADHLGVEFAIATSSCTGALHMGLAALGIGPGDEVIVADTNWIASVAPIIHLGATPVFVDIRPDTWCVDPDKVESSITDRTRAILAVHLYGNLCDMDRLTAIAERFGVPLVEDAAEAIGSIVGGRRAGSIGRFGAFSFHGTKTLTTGEGGMFVTNDPDLYERVLTLSNHGRMRSQSRQFWPDEVGFKYKMSNIQAAVGCGQMRRIDELIDRKREIFWRYHDQLQEMPGLAMNPQLPGTTIGAWMPTVVFDPATGITREHMQDAFARDNIDARVFFWPLSSLPMFEPVPANAHAWSIPAHAMNLPSFHDMTDVEQDRVVDTLIRCSDQKGTQ